MIAQSVTMEPPPFIVPDSIEDRLRLALERDEFVLHYQPKVDIASRAIVGLEALIRWRNPHAGLVPPADFITTARNAAA